MEGLTTAPRDAEPGLDSQLWRVPASWTWGTLGEIADIVGGGTPPSGDASNFTNEGVPWLTPADLSGYSKTYIERGARDLSLEGFGKCGAKMVPPGSVLFSSRAPIGYCVVAKRSVTTSQGFRSLVLRGAADPEYVRLFLIFVRKHIEGLASGTTFREISGSKLATVPIAVAPLSEQTRIVAAVNALFEEVEAGEAALARAREGLTQFRASLLHAACTGALTADWRAANPTNETGAELRATIARWRAARGLKPLLTGNGVDPAALPSLPQGWVWASLPQLGEFGRGKSKHRPRDDARLYGDAMPFIQTGEVSRSGGRITSWSRMYSDFGVAQSKTWPVGTVCITIAANIAASGLLTFEACFPDSVVGLVTPHQALARYVELFMQTARANLDAYAPATAQKNINLEILNTVAVPLPPLSEIEAIVQAVGDVQTEAVETLGAVPDSVTLRQSILHAAFTGRLVPQDPADEPAAALLARLRATSTTTRRPRQRRAAAQPDLIETPA